MKRRNKLALLTIGLAAVAFGTSSCTANFTTDLSRSRIAYAIDEGASEFVYADEGTTVDQTNAFYCEPLTSNPNIYQVIRGTVEEGKVLSYSHSSTLTSIIKEARESGVIVPNNEYFVNLDLKSLDLMVAKYNAEHENAPVQLSNVSKETFETILVDYGYARYYANGNAYDAYKAINNQLRSEFGPTKAASLDFEEFYLNKLNGVVDTYRSCITVNDDIKYGNFENGPIKYEKTTWKAAWTKGGKLIPGLIVYPVAWLIDTFAILFAGGKSAPIADIQAAYATGVPQILSIIVVTVIVRMFIFLCTIRSTLNQRKMTDLQPEIAKIQQKYPNANTNQTQKQRLAEEQMRLYKKHGVHPLSQLLVLIIQFPVFIGVWGAMTGSAVLSTGQFKNLDLSQSIWEALKMGPKNHPGWWTALILLLLMSVAQFFSMKVPQWIQKAKTKKVARIGRNPAQKQQNRTANIVSYVMLVVIIIMGFTLPSAMGVYWFIGAVISIIQTVLTQIVFVPKNRKR